MYSQERINGEIGIEMLMFKLHLSPVRPIRTTSKFWREQLSELLCDYTCRDQPGKSGDRFELKLSMITPLLCSWTTGVHLLYSLRELLVDTWMAFCRATITKAA
jgi:hypothetical protein